MSRDRGSKTARLGLVLSGGGARGIAHAGVLKAFAEHGIEPDCVSGTSAGALVGAFYAAGYPAEEIVDFFTEHHPFSLMNYALGKPGLFDTEKIARSFEEFFPDDRFEALEKKLYVTATDIVEARRQVFDSGPLIPAILASCSYPPIFTPTEIDGHLYVDGGVFDNFPVTPLVGKCDTIAGVYISPLEAVEQKELSNSLALLQRSFQILIHAQCEPNLSQCDVLIRPQGMAHFALFDTGERQEIFELGYQTALKQVDTIQARLRL